MLGCPVLRIKLDETPEPADQPLSRLATVYNPGQLAQGLRDVAEGRSAGGHALPGAGLGGGAVDALIAQIAIACAGDTDPARIRVHPSRTGQ